MISVCLASYNGAKYIKDQIDSILSQLRDIDELIISDDGSTDDTLSIISSYKDKRIVLLHANAHNLIKNFENAIIHAKGDIIFLADQDDCWKPGRLNKTIELHEREGYDLVICKAEVINADGLLIRDSYFEDENPIAHSLIHNLYHNPFLGNCMSFKRWIVDYALPFPSNIIMHDPWIGLVGKAMGKCMYYNKEPLSQYRSHVESFTKRQPPYSLYRKISYRLYYMWYLVIRYFKFIKNEKLCSSIH